MIRDILNAIGNLFTWFVAVAPWEQAVRARAGRFVSVLGPGFYIKIPFLDRVYRQSIRRRLDIIRPQTLTTKDGRCLTLAGAVGYRIDDIGTLYNTLHDAEDTIEAEVSSKISAFVITNTLADCNPGAIELHVRSAIDLAKYGLADQEFFLTNFAVARTMRLISGDISSWKRGGGIDTTSHDRSVHG